MIKLPDCAEAVGGKNIELAVFDLDGVIVNTAEYHYRAWKRLLSENWGVEHTRAVDDLTKGIGRYECLRLIAQQYHLPIAESDFHALADLKNRYYVDLLHRQLDEADLLPGIPETFSLLRRLRIPAALASSSFNAAYVVEKLHLTFDYQVDPGKLLHGKPAPDIYADAAAHFGCRPERCVGVEDAASGVASVKSAGLICIGIGQASALRGCDILLPDTRGLAQALASLISIPG